MFLFKKFLFLKGARILRAFRKKVGSLLWYKIFCYVLLPLYSFGCLLTVEYLNYRDMTSVFDLWQNPKKFYFAGIIFLALTVMSLFFSRKLWIHACVLGGFSIIVGLINCIKLAVNGDNFFPWDISMAGNMGELVGFARFDIPQMFWLLLLGLIFLGAVFWLGNVEIPIKWYIRLPAAFLITVPFIVLYNNPVKSQVVLNSFDLYFEDSFLQSSNYNANGFVNAFSINCFALKNQEPDGYNEQALREILEDYTGSEATASPDVVVIQSEAFWDIRLLNGTEFSENPLSNFDEISSRENTVSGKLYTTAMGGGTVRTEFEVMSGLSVDYIKNSTSPYLYISDETETMASVYRSQGYKTTGIHSYDGKFYSRSAVYPYLGFDEFITQDEIYENYGDSITTRRGYITDDTFMDVVIDTLESNTDTPNFIFGITMENHQQYGKTDESEIVVNVKNDLLSQDMLDSVTTFTQGVYNADLSLKKLVDYIDSCEKPTVIIFYGDHLPTLGSNQLAYDQSGSIDSSDGLDAAERDYLYSTPYIVYANYDVDFERLKAAPKLSSYHLLPLIAKCTGTKMTPFMKYMEDCSSFIPYYNSRLNITLDDAGSSFTKAHKLLTYDRVLGKKYSMRK